MAHKQDLIKQLKALGVKLTGDELVADLEVLIEKNDKIKPDDKNTDDEEDGDRLEPEPEKKPEAKIDTDYLRQYQYKKVNDVPTIGGVLTDPDKGSKAEKMKASLLAQPRVRILVPRTPGEHASVLMTVNLNGYRLDFPKNAYIELPEQCAELLMNSQKQTDIALQAFRVDSDDREHTARQKQEALG